MNSLLSGGMEADSTRTDGDAPTSRSSFKLEFLDPENVSTRNSAVQTDEECNHVSPTVSMDATSVDAACFRATRGSRRATLLATTPTAKPPRPALPCNTGHGRFYFHAPRLELAHHARGLPPSGAGRRAYPIIGARGPGPSRSLPVEGALAIAPGARTYRRINRTRRGPRGCPCFYVHRQRPHTGHTLACHACYGLPRAPPAPTQHLYNYATWSSHHGTPAYPACLPHS